MSAVQDQIIKTQPRVTELTGQNTVTQGEEMEESVGSGGKMGGGKWVGATGASFAQFHPEAKDPLVTMWQVESAKIRV